MADWVDTYWERYDRLKGIAKAFRSPTQVGESMLPMPGAPVFYFGQRVSDQEMVLVYAMLEEERG